MIRNRWMIPAAFGALCAVLAALSLTLSEEGVVQSSSARYAVGETHTLSNLALEADKRYTLMLRPVSGVGLNTEIIISAELTRDDAAVFSIEDAYWHERGTWSEGGESGSWEEQNSQSDFSFLVPESGSYDLDVSLESARGMAAERIEVLLVWRDPWLFTTWPLLIGALALFALAGWAHSTRRKAMGQFLEELGEGTRLRIAGTEFTVIGRMEHWEPPERVGVEFRMRAADGSERWLAIERVWREHPYMEDNDQVLVQTMLDLPLSDAAQTALQAFGPAAGSVTHGGEVYVRDRENEGWGTLVTVRDGTAYQTRYQAWMYRDNHRVPTEPGGIWVECLQWQGTGEVEWAVMRIADTDEIDVLEAKKAVQLTRADIFDRKDAAADPFGVAEMRGPRAAVTRVTEDAQNQKQQQQPHDWNS